ncbi:MAG: ATP-binding protein [Synergistaceae bacterium]
MLEDLSAHVLDIAENSVRAKSTEVFVTVEEKKSRNLLLFSVSDNGCGMTEDFIKKVTDPFTTTRTTRKVGMGLPFLKQSAELCDGTFLLRSEVGVGTTTTATFALNNIDTPPMGNIADSVMTLIMGSPDIHWVYIHKTDNGEFKFDLDEVVEALDGDKSLLVTPDVGLWLQNTLEEGIKELY